MPAVFLPRRHWRPRPNAPQHALGRLPAGALNKSEQAYARHLEEERRAGRVLWFEFEAVKLRLADNTFYTPDFAVLATDGVLEMHEVKGFWQDDARVKIKVAASLFPFRFKAMTKQAQKHGGGWREENFREPAPAEERLPELPGLNGGRR